jgi:hypothetical protein
LRFRGSLGDFPLKFRILETEKQFREAIIANGILNASDFNLFSLSFVFRQKKNLKTTEFVHPFRSNDA